MSLPPCRIDFAGEADIVALVELLGALFTIEQDFRHDRACQERGLRMLLDQRERAAIVVARDDAGRAIGMVTAQLVISTAQGGPSAWVEDLVVQDEHRGRGVGRALLERVLEWATSRGATRAQLLADLDNAPALAFYDQLGWTTTRLTARRWMMEATDSL